MLDVAEAFTAMDMLRTDCKLNQFVNGPPVYKPVSLVGPLSIIHSEVVPFRNQAERFESWPNGLEAGRMVYKQPERHEAYQTNSPWPERHEAGQTIY